MSTGGTTYNFTYDPMGRRKTWNTGGTTRNYLYDGLDLLSDGTNEFLNGAGIDQPLEKTASSISTYLQDHLGSTTQMTNSSGVSIGQYAYMPYGNY